MLFLINTFKNISFDCFSDNKVPVYDAKKKSAISQVLSQIQVNRQKSKENGDASKESLKIKLVSQLLKLGR